MSPPRRKKTDDPKTELMPKDLSAMEKISSLPEGLKRRMQQNVEILTRVTMQSNADLAKKFNAVCELLHYDIYSPKKADSMSKALNLGAQALKDFLSIDWPEKMAVELTAAVESFKENWFIAMKSVLSNEQYNVVKKKFDDITKTQ